MRPIKDGSYVNLGKDVNVYTKNQYGVMMFINSSACKTHYNACKNNTKR